MKTGTKKEQFIKMRIAGKSFEEIAQTLAVEKSLLINWNKETDTRTAISEGVVIRMNDEVRNLEMSKQNRLFSILRMHKKILAEIEKRDFSDMPTDKLIQLCMLLNQKINEQSSVNTIGKNEAIIELEEGAFFYLNPLS